MRYSRSRACTRRQASQRENRRDQREEQHRRHSGCWSTCMRLPLGSAHASCAHLLLQPSCKLQTTKHVNFGHRTEAKELCPRGITFCMSFSTCTSLRRQLSFTSSAIISMGRSGGTNSSSISASFCFVAPAHSHVGCQLHAGIPLATALFALVHVHCSGHACVACPNIPAQGIALPHASTSSYLLSYTVSQQA